MNEPAVLIPRSALVAFSASTQAEILEFMGLAPINAPSAVLVSALAPVVPVPNEDGPPDFTVAMARKLIAEPISPKTTAVLRAIAESASPEFHVADCINAVPDADKSSDLRGAWSGITRRARNILADTDADFVWWDGDPVYDHDGNYIDQVGRISQLTHQSLRIALSVRDTV